MALRAAIILDVKSVAAMVPFSMPVNATARALLVITPVYNS